LLEHKRVASNATHDWQHLLLQQNFSVILPSTFTADSTKKNNSVQWSFESATETISHLQNVNVGRQCRRRSAGTSRHFRRSCLKANKVSKSEGTRKVEYA